MQLKILGAVALLLYGCGGNTNFECTDNGGCNLSGGGMCVAASTGNSWCAYPDPGCPGGYRYSDENVGDGLSGQCASDVQDAGVDSPVDDGPPLNCPQTAPVQSGQAADLVLGQAGFTSRDPNSPFESGSSLSTPVGLLGDGGRLWVSDSGNARVLQWNSAPSVNGQSANIALGQTDMISSTAGTTQSQFNTGGGYIARAGSKLVISETTSHRVLIWNSVPTTNGQAADIVLGQTGFTTKGSGNSASQLNGPTGVWTDGAHLIVADRFNNRVLIWNSFPTSNGAAADVVLGAATFGTTPFVDPPTAASFRNPQGVAFDGTHLFVADETNNRVLVWSGIPTTSNAPATLVIGQTGFDSNFNNGGAPYPQVNGFGMVGPTSLLVDECGSLYICDNINARVLVFTRTPTGSAPTADAVLGKPDLMTQPNASTLQSDKWMHSCGGLAILNNALYASDGINNRVLRFALSR